MTYRQDQDELDDDFEDEYEPERRSPLIPIMAIVASLLAVGIGVAVVLYSIGVFGSRDPQVADAVTEPVDVVLNLVRTSTEETEALVSLVKPGGVFVSTTTPGVTYMARPQSVIV